MTLRDSRSFVSMLLDWHRENGRHDLPWRESSRTPFEVLVTEVLLQRTTAAAAVGGYAPLVTQYPTPACVAAATTESLKDLIAPLGLTKRAEYLQRCSEQLLERHGGRVPRSRSALLALHGVGEYTARSVAVHSFGVDVAAVDTNVRRLVSRFFDTSTDPDVIGSLADALVPVDRGSVFLHAMLDFAAAVCTARSPHCPDCPLQAQCKFSTTTASVPVTNRCEM